MWYFKSLERIVGLLWVLIRPSCVGFVVCLFFVYCVYIDVHELMLNGYMCVCVIFPVLKKLHVLPPLQLLI